MRGPEPRHHGKICRKRNAWQRHVSPVTIKRTIPASHFAGDRGGRVSLRRAVVGTNRVGHQFPGSYIPLLFIHMPEAHNAILADPYIAQPRNKGAVIQGNGVTIPARPFSIEGPKRHIRKIIIFVYLASKCGNSYITARGSPNTIRLQMRTVLQVLLARHGRRHISRYVTTGIICNISVNTVSRAYEKTRQRQLVPRADLELHKPRVIPSLRRVM